MEKIENEILSKVDEISQQMIASIQDIVKIKSVRASIGCRFSLC